jgi:hypothetical protein
MSLLEQTPGLLEALRGEMTPKFLATRSAAGVPNVVPVITMQPAEDGADTLFFGNFLLRKSIRNLKEDPRVGILVITQDLQAWMLRGNFLEFQRSGPYVDRQMSGSLLRYNAYTGIRDAGLIRICAVDGAFGVPRLQVARDYALARLAAWRASLQGGQAVDGHPTDAGSVVVPLPVQQEFARMVAVKVLAWLGEDGYPIVVPALSLQPAGQRSLMCWQGTRGLPAPPSEAQVAANILTFAAVSYQVKGRWTPRGQAGRLQVQEVYAGGPPIPGGRVA